MITEAFFSMRFPLGALALSEELQWKRMEENSGKSVLHHSVDTPAVCSRLRISEDNQAWTWMRWESMKLQDIDG